MLRFPFPAGNVSGPAYVTDELLLQVFGGQMMTTWGNVCPMHVTMGQEMIHADAWGRRRMLQLASP